MDDWQPGDPIVTPRPPRSAEEKEFDLSEVDSIYVDVPERFVVSLVVSYGDDLVDDALGAARAALDLTRDLGSSSTVWFVYDRKTQVMVSLEQSELEKGAGTL